MPRVCSVMNLLTPKSKQSPCRSADTILFPLAISKYQVPLQATGSVRDSIAGVFATLLHNRTLARSSSAQALPAPVPLAQISFVPKGVREPFLTGLHADSRRFARLK